MAGAKKPLIRLQTGFGLVAGVLLIFTAFVPAAGVLALSPEQRQLLNNDVLYFDPQDAGSPCISGGDLDRFLQALSALETGGTGDPTAKNPKSSAAGKYQYLTSTWKARFDLYPPASDYPTADRAPEEVQDAVAYIEYAQKWEEFNGDILKLAVSHFHPASVDNPDHWDRIIPPNKITVRQYAEGVAQRINEGLGNHIPLRYSEAPEFDKWLNKAVGDGFNPGGGLLSCRGIPGNWQWPHGATAAEVTSCYGGRAAPTAGASTNHRGVDISAGTGTPILAASAGKVTFAGNRGKAGLMVKVDHGSGLETQYLHNSRLLVNVGDNVASGQRIAEEGSTGNVTGAHLHFEIIRNGEKVNPLEELTIPDSVAVTGSNCNASNTRGQI